MHPNLPRLLGYLRGDGEAGGAADGFQRTGAPRDARAVRPRLRRMCIGVRAPRPRALQALRADVPGMRRRLPGRRRIALEIGLAEAGDALVLAGRIEDTQVQLQRLADPAAELSVVGEIVIGKRMDQSAKT